MYDGSSWVSPPSGWSVNSSTLLVTIQTTDTTLIAGGASVTKQMRLHVTRSSAGTAASDLTFNLALTNPCPTATLNMSSFSTTTVTVLIGSTATKTFSEMPDSTGNLSLCGSRTYSVLDGSNAAVSWASISGPVSGTYTITFAPATDNLYTSSPYTLKLHAVLATFTSQTADSSNFSVNLNRYACGAGTTYTASGSISAQTYIVGNTALTINPPTFTTAPYTCSETVTYAIKQ